MSFISRHLTRRPRVCIHNFATSLGAASEHLGSSWAFFSACLIVLVWAVTGPVFGFSDTWQMVINTGTTIVTFLMVFLIQHAQNHDARAMQLKLDELLRAVKSARNSMVDLEERSEEELTQMKQEFSLLSQVLDRHRLDPL